MSRLLLGTVVDDADDLIGRLGLPPWAVKIILVLLLLGLIANGFWLIVRVTDRLIALLRGLPLLRPRSKDVRRRVEQRRRYASHVEDRMRRLDSEEQWSDYRYTELEAEVETQSDRATRPLLRFLGSGSTLQRKRSLSRALRTTREPVVLLQGDPGSGKSVALRHLALLLARRARRSRRVDCPIPVYVNLKGLERSGRPLDAGLIERYVRERMEHGSTVDIDRFLAHEFSRGIRDGTWLFLFDSFDEIPEILAADDADEIITQYSNAVHDFLTAMRSCRGVVASRQFRAPRQTGWPTWTLVPLTDRRKRQLVARAQLEPEDERLLFDQLPLADGPLGSFPSNPMFLGLLCEYVRERRQMPLTTHEAFEQYVRHRLARDTDRLDERFGIEVDALRSAAESIAYCMVAAPTLGLTPTRADVERELLTHGAVLALEPSHAMDALEYLKLARGESEAGDGASARFTFAHRRFQEYFATCVVLREPDRVQPRQLLLDGRWRETAVTLLQMQETARADLLETAEQELQKMARDVPTLDAPHAGPPHGEPFRWPSHSLHVMELLQAGFARGGIPLPPTISTSASRIVTAAFTLGQLPDRKWAIEVCGLVDEESREALLGAALRSGSDWLRDAAAWQVSTLPSISEDLRRELRRLLLRLLGTQRLRHEHLSVRAQLSRLQGAAELKKALALLRVVPPVDVAVHLLVWLWFVYEVGRHGSLLGAVAGTGMVLGSLVWLLGFPLRLGQRTGPALFWRVAASRRPRDAAARRRARPRPDLELLSLFGFMTRAYVSFLPWIASGSLTSDSVGGVKATAFPLVVYAISWAPATLAVVEMNERVSVWGILLPQIRFGMALARGVMRTPKLDLLRVIGTMACLTLIAAFIAYGAAQLRPSGTAVITIGVAIGALLLSGISAYVWLMVVPTLHDLRWYLRWRRKSEVRMAPAELLEALAEQWTGRGASRLVNDVRTSRLLEPSDEADAVLLDLITAAERPADAPPLHDEDWRSPLIGQWLAARGEPSSRADRMRLLRRHGPSFVDELSKLYEEVGSRG